MRQHNLPFSQRKYSHPQNRFPSGAEAIIMDAQRRKAQDAILADPRPASVTFDHFIYRDLAARIAAGDCTVTRRNPIFGDRVPPHIIVSITAPDARNGLYILAAADGREWRAISGEQLAVTWHDLDHAAWKTLSLPMRRALRYLAGDKSSKPRRNTLRALESRGHIVDGKPTPSALALYRHHRKEFTDGN